MNLKPLPYREMPQYTNPEVKVIVRYKKQDLDATKKKGIIFLDTSFNPNEHVCQTAYIEGDDKILNEDHLLFVNDKILVQYLVGLDTADVNGSVKRNMFYIQTEDNGDEIRWCSLAQVFGKQTKDGFQPLKSFIFCDLIKIIPAHKENGIFVMEHRPDTEHKAFQTTIRYIHPHDSEEMGLNVGDVIVAEKNSDAIKKLFDGEELLRIQKNCILGVEQSGTPLAIQSA